MRCKTAALGSNQSGTHSCFLCVVLNTTVGGILKSIRLDETERIKTFKPTGLATAPHIDPKADRQPFLSVSERSFYGIHHNYKDMKLSKPIRKRRWLIKILVYGAGNIGSLYAARLKEVGQDVSILARDQRFRDLSAGGISLQSVVNGQQTTTSIRVVERLDVTDEYDLILVALPRHRISEVLPAIAANQGTPSVMFFCNNAAGPQEMATALGRKRVLLGFPGAAAVTKGEQIHYLILSSWEQPTTIGELNGTESPRIRSIGDALRRAGFPVQISCNMDAWLKTHVAEISPTANAFYMAGVDICRLTRTRDALLLMLRAIREGYAVLSANGIPVEPKRHRLFQWLPEPLVLVLMRRMLKSETTKIKIGHASEAREEMKAIALEFGNLIKKSGSQTPAIATLFKYLAPEKHPIPDGSSTIPVNWNGIWIGVGMLATVLSALLYLL